MTRGEGEEYWEEIAMWPTWNSVSTRWHHILRVMVVSVALCVSACTGPGHSSSTPSANPSLGGYAGPKDSGNGNGY
jgi:hypothetical protein